MPPKMTSTFNNEYYYPRDTMLTDATINCKAKNGQIKWAQHKLKAYYSYKEILFPEKKNHTFNENITDLSFLNYNNSNL